MPSNQRIERKKKIPVDTAPVMTARVLLVVIGVHIRFSPPHKLQLVTTGTSKEGTTNSATERKG